MAPRATAAAPFPRYRQETPKRLVDRPLDPPARGKPASGVPRAQLLFLNTRFMSRPNAGALREPAILMGIALPDPSFCLNSGSTAFRSTDLMPVTVSDTFAS